MSALWLTLLVILVLGIIVGNILLLRDSKDFKIPKGFKPRPDSDYDGGDGDYNDGHKKIEKNDSQDDK
ncbi:DUF2897 family protein [Agaribacter marinus]|uniref:DUF2897 domain-containing protein n=1 Tax=Agaribacter marinus TaxID=1431249 RepID=A0AA37SUQ6_9ALTE|nr:DUF2897 family protein [Agaribacter marinus]GLR70221.1 hypothetical protein GCM10007852_11290 [Agaribacter marinus]